MDYTDKIIVITGGGSGIGWALTLGFAEKEGQVYVLELNDDSTNQMIGEAGLEDRVICLKCDVSKQQSVRECITEIIDRSGRIDVLINNAGISHIGTAISTTEEDMDRVYQVNIRGVYNCLHCVLPHMVEQKSGTILNMASIAASLGLADRFAYSASKGAVLTMTYQVARDYIDHGIRCNSISPARVHTPFVDGYLQKNYPGREDEMYEVLSKTQPIGRMARPEEVADLALYLCSEKAGFITGTDYPIDGGFIRVKK